MKQLTPKQKLLSGVAVIGIVGVAADRLMLGSVSAAASEGAAPAAIPSTTPGTPDTETSSAQPEASPYTGPELRQILTDRRAQADLSVEIPNIFYDPSAVVKPTLPDKSSGTGHAPMEVSAVLISPGSSLAIINGKSYGTGQSVGDYTVKEITSKQVILDRDGREITLPVAEIPPKKLGL